MPLPDFNLHSVLDAAIALVKKARLWVHICCWSAGANTTTGRVARMVSATLHSLGVLAQWRSCSSHFPKSPLGFGDTNSTRTLLAPWPYCGPPSTPYPIGRRGWPS